VAKPECKTITFYWKPPKGKEMVITRKQYCFAEKVDNFIRWFCPKCKTLHIWEVTPPVIVRCKKCNFPVLIDDQLRMLEAHRWREYLKMRVISSEPKKIDPKTVIRELVPAEEVTVCPVCKSTEFRWTSKAVYCAKCGTQLSELIETYPIRVRPLESTKALTRYEFIETVALAKRYSVVVSELVWGEPYTYKKPYNGGVILYMTRIWLFYKPRTKETVGYAYARNGIIIPHDAVRRYELLINLLGLKVKPYEEEVEVKKPFIEPKGITFKTEKVKVPRAEITPEPKWAVEAALIAVGHGLTSTQISLFTGLKPETVKKALKELLEGGKVAATGAVVNRERMFNTTYVVPPEMAVRVIRMNRVLVKEPTRAHIHPATGVTYTAPPSKPPAKPPTPPVHKVPYYVSNPVTRHVIYPPAVWKDLTTGKVFIDYYPPEAPSGEKEQIQYLRFANRAEFLEYLKTEKGRATYESLKVRQELLRERAVII
jgi:DNA-binding Lrp family transcriptional regulator